VVTKRLTHLKVNYLDASAAVKLVLDEPGSDSLRQYFNTDGGFRITSLCLGEALGVLKYKWCRGQLSEKDYFDKCYVLLAYVRGKPSSFTLTIFNSVAWMFSLRPSTSRGFTNSIFQTHFS
jgi:hypothetical protein